MNRYMLTVILLAGLCSPSLAQVPITGALPPWSPPSPPSPAILQPAPPYHVQLPAGNPIVGYYKMDGYYVGGNHIYPYDTGEFNLAGFQGNARYFGTFSIFMPNPADVDPVNATVPYKICPTLNKLNSCGSGGSCGSGACSK